MFRRSKFRVKKQITHTLKPTPGKKTALEVWLEVANDPNRVLRFFVTHLDYKTEPQRMRELAKLTEITLAGGGTSHIILADLNSLTCSDYTAKEWDAITEERAKNQLTPKTTYRLC